MGTRHPPDRGKLIALVAQFARPLRNWCRLSAHRAAFLFGAAYSIHMADTTDLTESLAGMPPHYTTIETARLLGLAVRSVQLMMDRGELEGWKTPGGHRRIARSSVDGWMASNKIPSSDAAGRGGEAPRILLVEDSTHFQNLVSLLVSHHCPGVELHVADDGIAGLALYGRLQPHVLLVDILLPGIDGAALVTSLRSHPQFARSELIVITSLGDEQRERYDFALAGVPVAHKLKLSEELPPLLEAALARLRTAGIIGAAASAT